MGTRIGDRHPIFQTCPPTLSEVLTSRNLSNRSSANFLGEGKPVAVRFFDLSRQIARLFDEQDQRMWPNPSFPQLISVESDRLPGRTANPMIDHFPDNDPRKESQAAADSETYPGIGCSDLAGQSEC